MDDIDTITDFVVGTDRISLGAGVSVDDQTVGDDEVLITLNTGDRILVEGVGEVLGDDAFA